ncbi:Fe-S protein [Ignavibacterium album JCM 16511]|uniref:Fe-S protein n=1 Tax=Ignavibacterium album (strain DSM 19864 / JCM 16511 / NBRC 101810 / Mat9-16) TaxID=945713 RepID=I0AP99_IGNAJ|nr:Fe-S protein [Ignavibacterium album JCM 16511]
MLPLYLERLNLLELNKRAEILKKMLEECRICPNECAVNRLQGEIGNCHSADEVLISSYGPHFGEEPELVGLYGSGTIFFTNCNLSCVYCQNYDISQLGIGNRISIDEIANIMISLQSRGCHNINLVTPTHFVPQIVEALIIAIEKGLEIPLVYNCGGYESVETLHLLEDIIDIYMPDIKYSDNEVAARLSGIKNYWNVVRSAVKEMHIQVGDLHIDKKGIARRGLLVRHLVLPNNLAGSEKVIDFIADEISEETYLNIMDQYRPAFKAAEEQKLMRRIKSDEFERVVEYARFKGLHRGFV